MDGKLRNEGSTSYDLHVPAGYWNTSGQTCTFPTFGSREAGLYAETTIQGDHTADVQIDGPLGRFWQLRSKPLTDKPPLIILAITWIGSDVKLCVNGDLHEHQTADRST